MQPRFQYNGYDFHSWQSAFHTPPLGKTNLTHSVVGGIGPFNFSLDETRNKETQDLLRVHSILGKVMINSEAFALATLQNLLNIAQEAGLKELKVAYTKRSLCVMALAPSVDFVRSFACLCRHYFIS